MALALVTGALGGLGRATARRLAEDGMTVAVNDRDSGSELEKLAVELGGVPAPADVSDPVAVRRMVAGLGVPVDLLVVNAAYMTMAPLAEHDLDDWWRVIDTNLGGAFACVQAVLHGMQEQGSGRIVLVSSEWGVIGWPGATAYSASKAGMISLTKSLARELGPYGIAVNAIAPSVIDTPQLDVDARDAGVDRAEILRRYAGRAPLARVATPEEVAGAIAFLGDARLPSLTGQIVHVNGGTTRARA